MGKTTRFHPVSLNVIRGAVDFFGWKFGKIHQTSVDLNFDTARYTAEIKTMPQRVFGTSTMVMLNDLRDCFNDDIDAHWLRQTKSGKWVVDLVTRITQDDE